jgi:hypothetical protein
LKLYELSSVKVFILGECILLRCNNENIVANEGLLYSFHSVKVPNFGRLKFRKVALVFENIIFKEQHYGLHGGAV